MVKVFVAVVLLCIHVTLVCSDDYGGFFDSVEETATPFDEIVQTTTTRRTTTARPTTGRTTTARATQRSTRRTPPRVTTTETYARRTGVDNESWDKKKDCAPGKKCVSTFQCDEKGSVVVDGSNLIDERLDLTSEALGPPCPTLQVCCLKKNSLAENYKSCDSFSAPPQCGVRNPEGLGGASRSLLGTVDYASFAEFPWMVAVMNTSKFLGGGSLIHPKIVITVAHIIADSDNRKLIVRGGEYNTQSTDEICSHIEINVQNVIVHEQFLRPTLQNNLALLVLAKEFKMTATINTICLPNHDQTFEHELCVSSGWGKKNFEAMDRYQSFLKKVDLPVVPNEQCQELLRRTRLGEDFILHDKFLCAGGEEGKDVCTGDGGAPLMCPSADDSNIYILAGVVSGGIGCGAKDVPGFYTDIAKNRNWIDSKLRLLGIDTEDVGPRRQE